MRKVGIFGGTFNPPHNGHLLMANEVQYTLGLEEIWFMPNQTPPHKKQNDLASSQDRLNMLHLAVEDNSKFSVMPIELERDGASYTVDTMKILNERYPSRNFYFIIGGDMVEYLPRWYNIDELMDLVTFVGVKRPGYTLQTNYTILEVDVPQFDVSSSQIRERLEKGIPTAYLLPEKVRKYIEGNHLYGT